MRRRRSWLWVGSLLAAAGCGQADGSSSGSSSYSLGGLRLGLAIAEGVDLSEVDYLVEVPGFDALRGSLPVTGDALLGTILGVPAGDEIHISLTADNGAGVHCEGDGQVALAPGETREVFISLQCRLPDGEPVTVGAVDVSGRFNVCPQLLSADCGANEGGVFALSASATDLDGDALTFSWSAEEGSLGDGDPATDPMQSTASYTCVASGEQVLTVTVFDGQGCSDSAEVTLSCEEVSVPACGDGVLDDGEACDDGNAEDGDGCAADCTAEPGCGDGNLDEGEACDDGNAEAGDGCDADCMVEAEPSEIPCDVQQVLAAKCSNCHGATPMGAPFSIATLDDFLGPAALTPDAIMYERVGARIAADSDNPMPPSYSQAGALTDDERAILTAWVNAGAPGSSEVCASVVQ